MNLQSRLGTMNPLEFRVYEVTEKREAESLQSASGDSLLKEREHVSQC
jgi:hypothetical protein